MRKIRKSLKGFNNNRKFFFKLPDIVRFTERIEELGYRLAILVAA